MQDVSGKRFGFLPDLNTPNILYLALAAVAAIAFALAVSAWSGIHDSRHSINLVARDAVPSIIGAEKIRVGFLEMDAAATNEFLTGGGVMGEKARQDYEDARQRLSQELTLAAQNISFGERERRPIEQMLEKLQVYNGMVEAARANNRLGYPVGAAYLRMASSMLRSEMIPLTDIVSKLNKEQMWQELRNFEAVSAFYSKLILFVGLGLAATLASTQWYLLKRTKRVINPALLAASAALVVCGIYASSALSRQSTHLQGGNVTFQSVVQLLWNAKATVYDMKADQSLYLISRGAGQAYEQAFVEKSKRLSELSVQTSEMGKAFEGLSVYLRSEEIVRRLDKEGKRSEAVFRSVATGADSVNEAFATLNHSLATSLSRAQHNLDKSLALADEATAKLDWMFIGLALLTTVLALVGLMPRINEYRA